MHDDMQMKTTLVKAGYIATPDWRIYKGYGLSFASVPDCPKTDNKDVDPWSPNRNPKEHVWDDLEIDIVRLQPHVRTLKGIKICMFKLIGVAAPIMDQYSH
ncbi:hypothetical protein TNCV_1777761 [Trichonephila clavipes]|nr:hypothetical protein TNCV_1777761 [Trichonephila clavipes]